MKYLIWAVLFYFAYRLYVKPFLIDGDPAHRRKKVPQEKENSRTDGEYIDYEEVD